MIRCEGSLSRPPVLRSPIVSARLQIWTAIPSAACLNHLPAESFLVIEALLLSFTPAVEVIAVQQLLFRHTTRPYPPRRSALGVRPNHQVPPRFSRPSRLQGAPARDGRTGWAGRGPRLLLDFVPQLAGSGREPTPAVAGQAASCFRSREYVPLFCLCLIERRRRQYASKKPLR